ncbi:hypothetical protein ABZX40_31905 [Streptomyces sp. NPDC004610]|uniref:hypothetical protein n=1 Tax=Streptomyces sp. NPDC004610 TaxID=3154668 RepID=UPI0033A7FCD5
MNSDEERLLRGRVYGTDPDHPGARPGQRYVHLIGGPLDGLLLDITGWTPGEIAGGAGWTPGEIAGGAALRTDLGRHGVGGRAIYDPRPGDPRRFDWTGDSP